MNKIIKKYRQLKEQYKGQNAFKIFLYIIIHRLIENSYVYFLRHFGKLDDDVIIFESSPDYSDNSRAISDYIINHKEYERYRIFWSVEDADYCRKMFNNQRIVFLQNKDKYGEHKISNIKRFMTAKIVMGTHNIVWNYDKRIEGQRHIRLWHGCGYKAPSDTDKSSKLSFEFGCVPGPLFVKIFSVYWNVEEKYIKPIGFARYDWLRSPNPCTKAYKQKLLGQNIKLIVWMPTFRNDKKGRYNSIKEISHFPLMRSEEDWIRLDNQCKELKTVIAVKLHIFQKDYNIDFGRMSNIIPVTNEDFDKARLNLYDFLAVTDGLISDYSSVAFDYLIVDKPMAFALDDFEEYNDARGFAFEHPLDYMPGHHLYDFNDLIDYVKEVSLGIDKYKEKRSLIRKQAIHESENYCKGIINEIGL